MRPKLPPAPPEMPSRLRCFDPADWGAETPATVSEGPGESAEVRGARDRWYAARIAWGAAHGLTPLDVIRQGLNDRRRAAGLAPIDYDC